MLQSTRLVSKLARPGVDQAAEAIDSIRGKPPFGQFPASTPGGTRLTAEIRAHPTASNPKRDGFTPGRGPAQLVGLIAVQEVEFSQLRSTAAANRQSQKHRAYGAALPGRIPARLVKSEAVPVFKPIEGSAWSAIDE